MTEHAEPKRSLNFLDATLIVAGSMIGSGIFIVSADIARNVGGPGWLLLVWAIAGVMTVFAALSYGELAGMFPQAGGQYVYLREAYNPLIGFLYGWTLFMIVQSGTIAAVAVAFAKYTGVVFPIFSEGNIIIHLGVFKVSAAQLLGIFSILALTYLNSRGINYGKFIVRLFTSTKLLSLFGLIVLGIFFFRNPEVWKLNMAHFWHFGKYFVNEAGATELEALTVGGLVAAIGVGLVGSLFSSDAWNNVTFIAGEIQHPKRNIPLALFSGTIIVTALYILANVAYLSLLPCRGDANAADVIGRGIMFAEKDRVATAAATQIFGAPATIIMAVLIMISTFGCNNSIVLSSVRVYQAMAKDGLFFTKMKENNQFGVPGYALWVQFIWSSMLALSGKYGDLLDYVMFAVMLFYILTISGIFRLRRKMPEAERPYKAFGYPIVPAIYILLAAAFCINLFFMKANNTWPGLALVIIGVPVFYYWKRKS
ncbi:MAG TPA: amino acid permease [Chitinophagales bacterium]|nr:amino acid permease [Chitinophagales bacterium]